MSPPLPGFKKGEHDIVLTEKSLEAIRFVNPAAGDLRLQPDSPALGMGAAAHATKKDLAQVPRPDPPAVGAYETATP